MARNDVVEALEAIREESGGFLRPVDVVQRASDPAHPLHARFEWDDGRAAHAHRLWQARELIVSVHVERGEVRVQKYISLSVDRSASDGGYRDVDSIMWDDALRHIALLDAMKELELFRAKYQRLQELSQVFAVIEAMRDEVLKLEVA